jgi:LysR family transcriptional regulator, benzoate and cis,cis-muconate-responsive activator of ben and cat genes
VNLQQLRYFIVLAEELNFQRAAIRIPCAQSSLSTQVAKLEREIGEPLLVRHPRHCSLTEAGSRMYLEGLRLVHAADRAVDIVRGDIGRTRQKLRVGIPEEGIQSLLEVLLAAYRASHPDVEVIVESCEWSAMADLATSRDPLFDAVIWGTDTPLDGLEGFAVYKDPLMIIVGTRSPFADAETIDPNDVLDEPMANIGTFMQGATKRYYLSDYRNGTEPRYGSQERTTPVEILTAVGNCSEIIAMTAGTDVSGFDVRPVPLSVPLHLAVGVLIHCDEKRPHVRDFATIGTDIGRSLFTMIPHAISPDENDLASGSSDQSFLPIAPVE